MRVSVGTWEERITWKGHVEKCCSCHNQFKAHLAGLRGGGGYIPSSHSVPSFPCRSAWRLSEPTAVVHAVKSS